MIKDRLKELHDYRHAENLPIYSDDTSIQMNNNESDDILLSLLEKVGSLYIRIRDLNVNVTELRKDIRNHSKIGKFEEKISDVSTEARSLYKGIQQIRDQFTSDSHLVNHILQTHQVSLITFFQVANVELNNLKTELHEKHKKYVEKELQITGQTVTDEELEKLLEHPSDVFGKSILMETRMAKEALFDIQERHEQVTRIEKSLVELNQMFIDLAVLVKDQGAVLNRIENHVFEAREKAEQAKIELKQARVSQTKARKKKFIIAGIIFVVVLIFIIILATSL